MREDNTQSHVGTRPCRSDPVIRYCDKIIIIIRIIILKHSEIFILLSPAATDKAGIHQQNYKLSNCPNNMTDR